MRRMRELCADSQNMMQEKAVHKFRADAAHARASGRCDADSHPIQPEEKSRIFCACAAQRRIICAIRRPTQINVKTSQHCSGSSKNL